MLAISRRSFIAASAAVRARSAGRIMGANDRVRVGLIGCGGISVADTRAFCAHPEVEIPVVCDCDDAQIAATLAPFSKGELAEAGDGERFPAHSRAQGHRRLPGCAHPTIGTLCRRTGVRGARTCIARSRWRRASRRGGRCGGGHRNGRVTQMGTMWRSGDHYREAIEFVHSGDWGKVRQVRVWAYLDWVKDAGNPPDGPVPRASITTSGWGRRRSGPSIRTGSTSTSAGSGITRAG